MNRGLAVLCSVYLSLGLLLALAGSARAGVVGAVCPNPPAISTFDFGGVLIGNSSSPAQLFGRACSPSCSGLHATITGPNPTDFVLNSTCEFATITSCSIFVTFNPQGCGLRTATLTISPTTGDVGYPAGCPEFVITLTGFGCSFPCAIDATQTASGLSPTVRDRILRELFLAQATTGSIRCAHLNCALCLAQPEALRGRAGAQAIVDQINCLLVALCSPASGGGV